MVDPRLTIRVDPLPDWAVPWFVAGVLAWSVFVLALAYRDRRR